MTHETARQRARRHKRDPLGGKPAQIAPSYTVPPIRCANCGHSEIMHRREADGRCLNYRCNCTRYVEES